MGDLNITTHSTGGVTMIGLEGAIQIGESSAKLHQHLKTLVDEGKRQLVIDLAKVTAIDSSGLGSLIAGFATLERSGGTLKLVNLSPRVTELMTITKLFTVFEIFDSAADAIASFEPVPENATQTNEAETAGAAKGGSSLL